VISSYHKIVIRNLRNVYSVINLSGLSIGLTVFILISLWVADEVSYDRFHVDHQQIFRVVQNQLEANGQPYGIAVTPPLLSGYLKTTFQEVENACRAIQAEVLVRHEELAFSQKGLAADPSFFSLFTFPMERGNIKDFYGGLDKIIISKKMATSYFGNDDAIGKIFKIVGRDFMVVGVLEVPTNSHLQFDFVIPIEILKALGWETLDQWDRNWFHTYIKIKSGLDPVSFSSKIKNIIKVNVKESNSELVLQPLDDIYLHSTHLNNDMPGKQDIQYVYIFSSAALFILLIACINYTNLATARSMKRAKEAGVRKVAGATRNQLMIQYFSESLIYCVLAFGVAILLSWLLLPYFNELSEKTLSLKILSPGILSVLGITLAGCVLLTGAYPALLLSSLKPVVVFKGLLKAGKYSVLFRRALIIVQFTLSIALVLGTLVVHHQLRYIHSRNMGYDKENILTFHITRKVRSQYPDLKRELKALTGVADVTVTNAKLSFTDQWTDDVVWEGKDPSNVLPFHQLMVDHDFVKTFSISMAEGRSFSESLASDSSSYILNEEAVRKMNLSKAVGSIISMDKKRGSVIGIVRDFNFKSVHKKIEPMIIFIDPLNFNEVAVKLQKGSTPENVKAIEKIFKKFSPDRPFEYSFLDKDVDKLYKSEERTGHIFNYFSALSIFISCLGLVGIMMFTTEQRGKEMSIRKILGASSARIFIILSKESILLVVAANLIALPTSLYFMNQWLDRFAYRGNIPVYFLLVVALISILVTWCTISFFSLKTSRANPVDSLRSE
jgi:ABC-type antimicrobial peptide transport system permease subunit